MEDKNKQPSNADKQDMDKAPGEERGKKEKLTSTDLKGKKVDGDPEKESDQPVKNDAQPDHKS